MITPANADTLGPDSQPLAFFLHDGEFCSFVLWAVPSEEVDFAALMEEGDFWGSDCVQLTESSVFFGLGSDSFNQAIWVYLDTPGKIDPSERNLSATFLSRGEQICLGSLPDTVCGAHSQQFYLPEGEYEVRLLSWNLAEPGDNPDAKPALFLKNVHHELHFTSTANAPAFLSPVPDGRTDERTLD